MIKALLEKLKSFAVFGDIGRVGSNGNTPPIQGKVNNNDFTNPAPPYTDQVINQFNIRNRSFRNAKYHPIARRIVNYHKQEIAGSDPLGLDFSETVPEKLAEQINELWLQWQIYGVADTSGQNYLNIRDQIIEHALTDGDCFLIDKGRNYLLVSGRALYPQTSSFYASNSNRVVSGVELDMLNRPLAYWFEPTFELPANQWISGLTSIAGTKTIPASACKHVILSEKRMDETRGQPIFTSVLSYLELLFEIDQAFLSSIRKDASLFMVLTKDPNLTATPQYDIASQSNVTDVTNLTQAQYDAYNASLFDKSQYGALLNIEAGYKMERLEGQKTIGEWVAMRQAIIAEIGAGSGIPIHILLNDYSKTNFTSGRMSSLDMTDMWKNYQIRLNQTADLFIYQKFLMNLMKENRLTWNRFDPTRSENSYALMHPMFINRLWTSLDIEKQINPLLQAISTNTLSRSRVLRMMGVNTGVKKELKDILKERSMYEQAGLNVDFAVAGAPQAQDEKNSKLGEKKNDV